MHVIHHIPEFRKWRRRLSGPAAATVTFAPTMGALHDGHASLVKSARNLARNGTVLSSIFVNPTQFGPSEDFSKYPRTLDADLQILADAGCDAVFVPSADEMYSGIRTLNSQALAQMTSIDPGPLSTVLEGAIRPGHFRGVCTVVAKLLNAVQPTHLLLGQKDFQQQAILRRMCIDLNMPVEVVTCPTVRDADGLAMSSRNRYLNPDERSRAVALYEGLTGAKRLYDAGERSAATLESEMRLRLEARHLQVQYAVAAHPETLALWVAQPDGRIAGPCVFLIAAKLGSTRLIDNMLL
ncbi:MAG TPA: pantoate--beta-alanine ligase [Phycisphaerae bacterium]|nr:pantoate--beta-alanine ligase [Phycisphaerae bacterium]